jgi:hypothetical protein
MRTLNTIAFLIIIITNIGFSKTITVNNLAEENLELFQFKDLAKAYKNSQSKDTILFIGSNNINDDKNMYCAATEPLYISKDLIFVGPGFLPQNKSKQVARLGGVLLGSGSSGSQFLGLVIDKISFITTQNIFDYKFDGCYIKEIDFTGIGKSKIGDMLFLKCFVSGKINFAKLGMQITGVVFRNNILHNVSFENSGKNAKQVYLLNNNFLSGTPFLKFENAIIANNLFYKIDLKGATTSTFNNNITFNCKDGGLIPYGNNEGKNNLCDLNPQIEKLEEFNSSSIEEICNFNWSMKENSPGTKAGTDFTDIGIVGGIFPAYEFYTNKIFSGEPKLKK